MVVTLFVLVWKGVQLLLAALLIYAVGTAVYNVYFHPLSKYPGPLICKLTDAYYGYKLYGESSHVWMYEMEQKYGE